ncbi:MAG: TRAP-type mannitol/chloroaromatic compound transport system permease small subunit [Gammaproteobacteria bacterium]|jgi:TRAP-type mannitol/chloroaromatic compound transport system permease small subunit
MKNTIFNFLNRISSILDCITELTGKFASWLVLFLVIIVSYDVTMRYIFQSGSIAIQELEWHVFSLIFLLGAAYTLKHDDHVRLDLLYQSKFMNDYRRAWVNFLGCLLFLIPFCILVIVSSWHFIHLSYSYNEGSPDPGGLSYRWIIKSAIPLSFTLLLLQGISYSIKSLSYILDNKS